MSPFFNWTVAIHQFGHVGSLCKQSLMWFYFDQPKFGFCTTLHRELICLVVDVVTCIQTKVCEKQASMHGFLEIRSSTSPLLLPLFFTPSLPPSSFFFFPLLLSSQSFFKEKKTEKENLLTIIFYLMHTLVRYRS